MKKWFACAGLALIAMTEVAWDYTGRPEPPRPAAPARPSADPYSCAEAQRHFRNEPTHWVSHALVTQ